MTNLDGATSQRSTAAAQAIESRIEAHYDRLPGSERRVADAILDYPGHIASHSATELAALAGASKAAVTRLIRRLGFDGYHEARRQARDAQAWGSPLYLHDPSQRPEGMGGRLEAHLRNDVDILTRTLQGLSAEQVEQAAAAIAGARRVWLLGFRNSYMMADYLRWQLIQVREDVHLCAAAGETLAEYLAGMSPRDLLIVVGIRRRLGTLLRAMEQAREAGVPILYITDPTAGESARLADWTLRCQVRGASLFDSYVAVISLLHLLSSAVVEQRRQSGRAHLKRIEKIHDALGEFE